MNNMTGGNGEIQGETGEFTGGIYPLKNEKTNSKAPDWIIRLEAWRGKGNTRIVISIQRKRCDTTRNSTTRTETAAPEQTPAETTNNTSHGGTHPSTSEEAATKCTMGDIISLTWVSRAENIEPQEEHAEATGRSTSI